MTISLQGVVGRGEFERVLDLSVSDGEVLAITGPNGSGKSTVIHTIAGLIPMRSGQLIADDTTWDSSITRTWVEPENRTCAVVFQDLRLFPHISVIANIAYGLRARGLHKDEAEQRSQTILERVGLKSFETRRPNNISGGERQRVALARALVLEPRVLLLDEPLSAVDAASRSDLRDLLPELLAGFSGATILVTHDQTDVEALATTTLGLV
jgi:molybdate transport system ATP-binding protein